MNGYITVRFLVNCGGKTGLNKELEDKLEIHKIAGQLIPKR